MSSADAAPSPASYAGVVVGDSIHGGRHSKKLTAYLREHADALSQLHTALFQVSLTSTNSDATHTAAAQGLVDRLVEQTGFRPDAVGLFAGKLAYTRYGWLKRRIIRRIARSEGGDTDTSRDCEYTDWDAVDRFAAGFAATIDVHRAVAP